MVNKSKLQFYFTIVFNDRRFWMTTQKTQADIHQACHEGNLSFVSSWISNPNNDVNKKDAFGWTLLHAALANRKYDVAICLLNHPDIAVHSINRDTTTPLHYAIKLHEDETPSEKLFEILQLLVDKG